MGYSKIYDALLNTSTAQNHIRILKQGLHDAKIEYYTFTMDDDAIVSPKWVITDRYLLRLGRKDNKFAINLTFENNEFIANRILNNHFGKDVKSNNTKKKVFEYGGKISGIQFPEFSVFFRNHFHNVLSSEILEAEKRVNLEIHAIITSKEYEEKKLKFLCDSAISQILKVFKKFKCVPDDILSKAIREAKIDGIMEW